MQPIDPYLSVNTQPTGLPSSSKLNYISIMSIHNQRKSAFWRGFWQGMAASCLVFAPPASAKAQRPPSDLESMRADWRRIGADFDVAIKKARKEFRTST
jgi:hypothetical protein